MDSKMRRPFALLGVPVLLLTMLAACDGEAEEDQTAGPDTTVLRYLELMDDLAAELARVASEDGSEDSVDQVIRIASQLEEYLVFFVTLEGERRAHVFDTYGDRLRQTAETVGGLATTGPGGRRGEQIALALQRTPAFAPVGATTER